MNANEQGGGRISPISHGIGKQGGGTQVTGYPAFYCSNLTSLPDFVSME